MTLRKVELKGDPPADAYPFDLPLVGGLPLELSSPVTILVGENGSGKSTLIEAIAVAAGFNPEGGSGQVWFETEPTHSELADHLKLTWRPRLRPGWFLRAETFYNVATYRDRSPGRSSGCGATCSTIHTASCAIFSSATSPG